MRRRAARAAVLGAACAALVAIAVVATIAESADEQASWAVWVFLDHAAASSSLPHAVSDVVIAARGAHDYDRPVDPTLVGRIADTGADIRHVSRWLRAVSVNADAATLQRLRRMPEVTAIVPLRSTYPTGSTATAQSAPADSSFYGATYAALRELNIPVVHELGFTGSASRIAILDTGFSLTHETIVGRNIVDAYDFLRNDDTVDNQPGEGEPNQERHGTFVFSLLGGYAPGRLVGGAYSAAFYLAKVDLAVLDTEADEDRWVQGVEWADSVGARIINSSIGFRSNFTDRPQIPYGDLDGNTTVTTRMADEAARRNILIVQSIGDLGPATGTLWAPADADSILVVGAIERVNENGIAIPAASSSRGPTADGRIKPDVVARGAGLVAASTAAPMQYEGGLTGSSYATPFVTAGAALFWEAWPSLSALAVRDAIRDAGHRWHSPDNVVGFGVPDIAAAIMFPQGILLTQNSIGPMNQADQLTTIAPTFSWVAPLIHPLMRPILYRVEIASDSAFTNIVFTDSVREAFSLTARVPLKPVARAWWRVTAESPQGVRRSTAPRPSFSMPSWVTLLTLNEAEPEFVSDLRPQLSWAPRSAPVPLGPFTYTVQILSPAGAVVQQINNITTTTVQPPEPLTPNQSYRWRVIARTQPVGGGAAVADTTESAVPFVVVSDEAPPATLLYQNFPNPFPRGAGAHITRIWLDIARDGPVELAVYDLRGRLVRRLIPAREDCGTITLIAGIYGRSGGVPDGAVPEGCVSLEWDARDSRGDRVPRGVYLLRLRAGGVTDVRRILYMPAI